MCLLRSAGISAIRLEERREDRGIGPCQDVLLVDDIEHDAAVIGVDDHLDGVADVVGPAGKGL